MNDTVTKLLYLADDFAAAAHNYFVNTNSKPKWEKMGSERQALQDELGRLFTPLRGQPFNTAGEAIAYLHGYAAAHDKYKIMGADPAVVGLAIHMEEHGITGESNEPT